MMADTKTVSSTSSTSTNPLESSILIIGAGISGLATAKTLFEDGFTRVTVISSADRVGGVWASGDAGGVYPGLLTNSAYGNFELSALPMPREDLEQNEHRIKGETVSRYLEEFYRRFLQGRVDFRFSTTAVRMTRHASGSGWVVTTCGNGAEGDETAVWDKVVLAQGPHSIPSFPAFLLPSLADPAGAPSDPEKAPDAAHPGGPTFSGLLYHTSQIHASADQRILASTGPIVVIGCGKSAIDLAARYASRGGGREVTIVFRKPKYFSGHNLRTDYFIKTRLISTYTPHQVLRTVVERLLHRTRLGAWWLRRWQLKNDARRDASLGVYPDSPLYRNDLEPIWRGPDVAGGRSSATRDDSFHKLVASGRIRAISGVRPVGVTPDGNGLVLDNGEALPARVVICGTGFRSSCGFIERDERIRLGIEPESPRPRSDPSSPIAGYTTLANPPAQPSEQEASHVYKGIVPYGAFEERDLVMNGFQGLLGIPLTAEISSNFISAFFQRDPNLRLPPTAQAAFDHAEAHANWLRARFPASRIPYDTQHHFPLFNASQYNDELLEDMRLPTFREPWGWFGLGYYYNLTSSQNYRDLARERLALRFAQ